MNGKNTILMILDGWGLGSNYNSDAIAQAYTPNMNKLMQDFPNTTLITYGEDVGLPEGQMGNSEVGHLNIGAGRVVYQELARINKAIKDNTLENQPAIQAMIQYCLDRQKPLHLIGLASDGGVHAHIDHLKALIDIFERAGVQESYVHAFTDGRDTSPTSGLETIRDLVQYLEHRKTKLASLIGRYYAMDRDHRWERISKAYHLLVDGHGDSTSDPLAFISYCYKNQITDEFLLPWINKGICSNGDPVIKDEDAVLFFNFRTDRPRQLTEVLTQRSYPEFGMKPLKLFFVSMTNYESSFKDIKVVYEADDLINTIGEVVSNKGLTQVRVAETEKYPHVTFFFNGGREEAFNGESRLLIPSPKVATYDLQPEMSAEGVKDAVLNSLKNEKPNFICVNFANTDMVGHTGDFEAAKIAANTVDQCVGEIISNALFLDYWVLIIADHGNSDYMINEDGSPNTAHTKNPVPCILVGNDVNGIHLNPGKLADIAPTLLALMGVEQPKDMTGNILFHPNFIE